MAGEGLRALREERALRTTGMTDTNKALSAVANMQRAAKTSASKQKKSTPASSSPATTSVARDSSGARQIYDSSGNQYTPQVRGNMLPNFRDNPNRDYEGLGQIVQGNVRGYRVDDRSNLRIYMTKTGKRGVQYEGNTYYEVSPGSGSFKSVVGAGEGGTLELADLGRNKAETAAAAAAEEVISSGGGSRSGSSGGSGTVDDSIKESESKVDERIKETEDFAADAKTEIGGKATTFPGAPDWVKTVDDYENWLRSKSAKAGFASTIKTSATGLAPTALTSGVKVTSLSG